MNVFILLQTIQRKFYSFPTESDQFSVFFFFFPNMNANICLAFLLHLKSLFSLKLDQCKGKSNFKRLTCRNHIFNIFLMQYSIQYIYFFLMLFDTKKLMCKLSVINFICILLPSFRKDEILYEKQTSMYSILPTLIDALSL